jgi:hypothetical protein
MNDMNAAFSLGASNLLDSINQALMRAGITGYRIAADESRRIILTNDVEQFEVYTDSTEAPYVYKMRLVGEQPPGPLWEAINALTLRVEVIEGSYTTVAYVDEQVEALREWTLSTINAVRTETLASINAVKLEMLASINAVSGEVTRLEDELWQEEQRAKAAEEANATAISDLDAQLTSIGTLASNAGTAAATAQQTATAAQTAAGTAAEAASTAQRTAEGAASAAGAAQTAADTAQTTAGAAQETATAARSAATANAEAITLLQGDMGGALTSIQTMGQQIGSIGQDLLTTSAIATSAKEIAESATLAIGAETERATAAEEANATAISLRQLILTWINDSPEGGVTADTIVKSVAVNGNTITFENANVLADFLRKSALLTAMPTTPDNATTLSTQAIVDYVAGQLEAAVHGFTVLTGAWYGIKGILPTGSPAEVFTAKGVTPVDGSNALDIDNGNYWTYTADGGWVNHNKVFRRAGADYALVAGDEYYIPITLAFYGLSEGEDGNSGSASTTYSADTGAWYWTPNPTVIAATIAAEAVDLDLAELDTMQSGGVSFITQWLKRAVRAVYTYAQGKYTKPSGGIPDADIASAATWSAKQPASTEKAFGGPNSTWVGITTGEASALGSGITQELVAKFKTKMPNYLDISAYKAFPIDGFAGSMFGYVLVLSDYTGTEPPLSISTNPSTYVATITSKVAGFFLFRLIYAPGKFQGYNVQYVNEQQQISQSDIGVQGTSGGVSFRSDGLLGVAIENYSDNIFPFGAVIKDKEPLLVSPNAPIVVAAVVYAVSGTQIICSPRATIANPNTIDSFFKVDNTQNIAESALVAGSKKAATVGQVQAIAAALGGNITIAQMKQQLGIT